MGITKRNLRLVHAAFATVAVLTLGGCSNDGAGAPTESIRSREEADEGIGTGPTESMELVQNGSFDEWTEDGMPKHWNVRPGRIEHLFAGEDSAVLLIPNLDPSVPRFGTLRYKISLPEDAAGKDVRVSMTVISPDNRVTFSLSAPGAGQILKHVCWSATDSYTYNEETALLPESVGSSMWLIISVPAEVADGVTVDDVSVMLIAD